MNSSCIKGYKLFLASLSFNNRPGDVKSVGNP